MSAVAVALPFVLRAFSQECVYDLNTATWMLPSEGGDLNLHG